MKTWAGMLLGTDLVAMALFVVDALGEHPRDAEPARTFRRCRLAGVGLAGSLIAVVALGASDLGVGVGLALSALALFAGFLAYMSVLAQQRYFSRSARIWTWTSTGLATGALVLLVFLTPRPQPDAADLDSARLGVPVDRHYGAAESKVVDHLMTLADVDADVAGPQAVPVERHLLDGDRLTLVVTHRATCVPTVVLLRTDADTLLVAAVFYPTSQLADGCQPPNPMDTYFARSVLEVALPAGMRPSSVRDVRASLR